MGWNELVASTGGVRRVKSRLKRLVALLVCVCAVVCSARTTDGEDDPKSVPAELMPPKLVTRAVLDYESKEDGGKGGGEAQYAISFDGQLVIEQEGEILIFRNEAGGARLHERWKVKELIRQLKLDAELPDSVQAQICLLSRLSIPREQFVSSRFLIDRTVYEITMKEGWQAKQVRVGVPRSASLDHSGTYWVSFKEDTTPVFHFFNGKEFELFEKGRYGAGYTWPFRFGHECRFQSMWGNFAEYNDETEKTVVIPAKEDMELIFFGPWRVGGKGQVIRMPTKGMHLESVVLGFDGSVSVLMRQDRKLVWYHVR